MKKSALPLLAVLLISGCAPHLYSDMPSYMKAKKLPEPTLEIFPHCEGYGCPIIKNIKLNKYDWKNIDKAFGGKAKSAEEERIKIARTIGTFETIVGKLTGTDGDLAGTFGKTGPGQLDCVDESTNTTIYMMLLAQKGLIKFHTIEQPQVRYPLVSGRGWMHQTAVIKDMKTKKEYAMDSWFEDNGRGAWVVFIPDWLNGWHPELVKPKD